MSRRRQPRRGVRVLVAALLLVAIGGLFAALSAQLIGGHRADLDRTGSERQAVGYLRAVSQLVGDLVEARSAAVRGQTAAPDLQVAMTAVSDVDGQLGEALLTTERWLDLRSAIDLVLSESPTGVDAADRYTDLVAMAIDLLDAVAAASQLSADPEPASRSLVVSVRELLSLAAATGQAADFGVLSDDRDPDDAATDDDATDEAATNDQVELAVALHDAASAYRTLVGALTTSVDGRSRPAYTSTAAEQLDLIHSALGPWVGPAALRASTTADPAALDAVAVQMRGLTRPASQTVLDELDVRLADRESAVRDQMLVGVGTAAAGFLLGLVVLWWSAAPPAPSPEHVTDSLVDGPDVASVSVQLPAVDARELLALEELVHVGRGVRGRPSGGGDDAE